MVIKRKRGWEIGENKVTPEAAFLNRRNILIGGGVAVAAGAIGGFALLNKGPMTPAQAAAPGPATAAVDPSRDLYPAVRNAKFVVERPVTAEAITQTYNNFYEYGE